MLPRDIQNIKKDGEAIKITFKESGSVTISDYFKDKSSKTLKIKFSDNSVWDNDKIDNMIDKK